MDDPEPSKPGFIEEENRKADRTNLKSAAVTEHNYNMYSQRRGHLGGSFAIESLTKMIEESGIGLYTVEQVISKADPSDYKQELARLGYVLKVDHELSPGKI